MAQPPTTVLDNFNNDLTRLLSPPCPVQHCSNPTQCLSFRHFQKKWSTLSFSYVHLAHAMSTPDGGKQRKLKFGNKRTYEKLGRNLLQGMFHTLLTNVLAAPPSSTTDEATSSSPHTFVQTMYALYCLHGTQLFTPPEPIRIETKTMAFLMQWESAAVAQDTTGRVACVVGKLILKESFRLAMYTGPTTYDFIHVANCAHRIEAYNTVVSSSDEEGEEEDDAENEEDMLGDLRSVDDDEGGPLPRGIVHGKRKKKKRKARATATTTAEGGASLPPSLPPPPRS